AVANANGSVEVNLTVYDSSGAGLSNTTSFMLSVTAVNDNPLFESISDFTQDEDFSAFTLDLSDNISDVEEPDSALEIGYTLNDSSVFSVSVNNATDVVTFTAVANASGSVEVNLTVYDSSGAGLSNTTSFILSVLDATAPIITLDSPSHRNWAASGAAVFNFTVTDRSPLSVCKLYGNFNGTWMVNYTLTSLTNATTTNFSIVNLPEGNYTWNVWCNDTLNNGAFASSNYTKYVDLTNPAATAAVSPSSVNQLGTVAITCTASDSLDPSPSAALTRVQLPDGSASSDLDGTFTDTTRIGTYTVTCRATDTIGKTASTTTTFSVTAEQTTGTSGGGGGTAATQTASVATTIAKITPQKPAVVKLDNEKLGVTEIELDVKNEANNVKLTVSSHITSPSGTPAITEGMVYKYIQIDKTNIDNKDIKSAKITFFVTKQWLDENNLGNKDVVLKKYTTNWVELPTKIVKLKDDKYYYEGTTSGFSVFAIGTKAVKEEPSVEAEEPAVEAEEPAAAEEAMEPAEEKSRTGLIVLIIVGVALIAGAVVLVLKKRKPGHYHKRR
ncbi:MAG: PGF-pre-PGF domain-containing protein, partial [Candidatus Woesearchaeota archaeon]